MKSMNSTMTVLAAALFGCGNDSIVIESKDLFIDHYKTECHSFSLSLCMRSKTNPEDEWSFFYEEIEGFDYEWGYSYKLRVSVSEIKNPPEDVSPLQYRLIEILSQEKESTDTTFDISASRSSGLVTYSDIGIYELYGDKAFSCLSQECESIESLITQDLAMLFEFSHSETPSEPMRLIQVKCSSSRESFRDSCL